MSWLQDFVSLIYPHQCVSCGKTLHDTKNCICLSCQYTLPKTNFHKEKDNPVAKIFWGKVNIFSAMAYYYFDKESKVQNIIHALKYKGISKIGEEVGIYYGNELKKAGVLSDLSYVIPVPLHPKKLKKRGYNQAEAFGNGLAEGMSCICLSDGLIRKKNTTTQTQKSQFERWLNVDSVFEVKHPEIFENKHVLLVDDVVTTGSTLEACAQVLLEVKGIKVSIATMAYAQ